MMKRWMMTLASRKRRTHSMMEPNSLSRNLHNHHKIHNNDLNLHNNNHQGLFHRPNSSQPHSRHRSRNHPEKLQHCCPFGQ